MSTEVAFSTFLRQPNAVIAWLKRGDVVLKRRGQEALRLSVATRAEEDQRAVEALTHLISDSLEDAEVRHHVLTQVGNRFPWLLFLPDSARESFLSEFVRTARACATVGRFGRLEETLAAWRSTAEIYADPQLLARLTDPLTLDGEDIPAPGKQR